MPIFRFLCSRQYFPYISLALFLAVVPLYFVSTIFITVLPLYFVYYIHGSAALIFRMLYPWLYEVLAGSFTPLCVFMFWRNEREYSRFFLHTAERLANRRKESKNKISAWIKARLNFALIRSMLMCLRRTRTPSNVDNISEIDLCAIVAESTIEWITYRFILCYFKVINTYSYIFTWSLSRYFLCLYQSSDARGRGSILTLKGPRCLFKLSLVSRLGLRGQKSLKISNSRTPENGPICQILLCSWHRKL